MKILFSLLSLTLIAAATQAAQAQSSPTPTPMMSGSPMPMMSGSPMPMMSGSPAAAKPGPMMNPATSGASPAPSPSPSASPAPKFIQFSGFADAAYTSRVGNATTRFSNQSLFLPESPVLSPTFTQTAILPPFPSRVFDYNDRTADLQNLNVQAALSAGNLAGKLELSAGTDADIIASYPGAFNGFDVTQAYLSYTLGKFTVQGGKFETLAGAEVIESPSDLNFSRSILFGFAVPFTHTGGRFTYAATPHLNVIGGVNAGWDEIRSTNGRLTTEYGFAYNPSAAVSLTAQGYTGIEQLFNYSNAYNPYASSITGASTATVTSPFAATGNQTGGGTGLPPSAQGQRTLLDIVGTVHPTAATTFTVNYDHGLQHNFTNFVNGTTLNAGWSGLAGYASYQVNPRVVASIRYEGFSDPQGYRTGIALPFTGAGQFWHEGTATIGYNLTPAITLRSEYRHDTSNQDVFLKPDNFGLTNNNSTFALEGFVKF